MHQIGVQIGAQIGAQIGNAAAGIVGKSQVVDQSANAASTHASNTIYSLGNGCAHMRRMPLPALPWPCTALGAMRRGHSKACKIPGLQNAWLLAQWFPG